MSAPKTLSVLVANTKGGCGKTTIATHVAAAFAGSGHATALADVDRQGSSLAWARRRPSSAPIVMPLDWSRDLDDPPRGIERLVLDAPAALKTKQIEALLSLVDMIVLPVLPSVFDEDATARFLRRIDEMKPIRKDRVSVAVIGNRVKPRTRAAARLDRFLAEQGHAVVTRLRESSAYQDAALAGLAVFDLPPSRSAALRQDWRPLLRWLEDQSRS